MPLKLDWGWVQQGDPVRLMGFCLTTNPLVQILVSDLVAWYLDLAVLGGCPDDVLADLRTTLNSYAVYGLELHFVKCEIFALGG